MDADEFEERLERAREAIKSLHGKPEGVHGPTLFVSHHLKEIEPTYWRRTVGVEQPNSGQVLDALVLVDSRASGGGEFIDTFDFGLPEDASNYRLSVRLGDGGRVLGVAMES